MSNKLYPDPNNPRRAFSFFVIPSNQLGGCAVPGGSFDTHIAALNGSLWAVEHLEEELPPNPLVPLSCVAAFLAEQPIPEPSLEEQFKALHGAVERVLGVRMKEVTHAISHVERAVLREFQRYASAPLTPTGQRELALAYQTISGLVNSIRRGDGKDYNLTGDDFRIADVALWDYAETLAKRHTPDWRERLAAI